MWDIVSGGEFDSVAKFFMSFLVEQVWWLKPATEVFLLLVHRSHLKKTEVFYSEFVTKRTNAKLCNLINRPFVKVKFGHMPSFMAESSCSSLQHDTPRICCYQNIEAG